MLVTILFRVFRLPVSSVKIYRLRHKTIILSVVLYGCETLSITCREEHGLSVFGNRVLRVIFGPKREGVAGCW